MKKLLYAVCLAALMAFSCGGSGDDPVNTGAPEAPAGLKLHSSSKTQLVFQWSTMENAVSYKWRLLKGSSEVQSGSVNKRNVSIDDLEPGTEYRFGVKSVGANGEMSAETTMDVKTEDEGSVDPGPGPGPGPGPTPDVDPAEVYARFAIPSNEEDGVARAFPGAEGGGMYTTGGRGGSVYHVTNLNDSGEGSLRYGVETVSGARTIVFDVAGVIELQKQLVVKKGDVYIAGQSAPGNGICLKNYGFRIQASNVIVRFIRCRMGDEMQKEDDAMQVMEKYGDELQNIIIDHCSVSWSTDECASFYGMKNFSFQWNVVSESLRNSVHSKETHGYGGIWGGTNASYHHNLLAHHDSRNPRIDHDYVSHQKGPVSIYNNVVYNWSGNTCYGGESSGNNEAFNGSTYRRYNFFNNYYKPGPATPSNHIWFLQPTTSCSNCGGTIIPGRFYMDGNVMHGRSGISSNNWTAGTKTEVGVYCSTSLVSTIKASTPFSDGSRQSIHSGEGCLDPVLTYAGASYVRDGIDTRIADEARNGRYTYSGSNGSSNGLIDSQTDVGGWPEYTFTTDDEKLRDSDSDGMPNWFEDEFGLNKAGAADAKQISLDINGRYTNLEMYLHYLVKDIVAGQNQNATYTTL